MINTFLIIKVKKINSFIVLKTIYIKVLIFIFSNFLDLDKILTILFILLLLLLLLIILLLVAYIIFKANNLINLVVFNSKINNIIILLKF